MPKARCHHCHESTGLTNYYDEIRCIYCGRTQPQPAPEKKKQSNPFAKEAKRRAKRQHRRIQNRLF